VTKLVHANSFRDLLVYQKARTLARSVFLLSASFPPDEIYSLTSQIRRSSRSVGAQIAEAWGKRRYEKSFVSQLTSADGEQMETQHWLDSAVDFGCVSADRISPLLQDCQEIGRMLGGAIAKAELFCRPDALSIKEEQALYFVSTPSSSLDT
jgi:four helix bundle protein